MIETVGVLGGTFDPVHVAHVRIAEAVRRALRLPRVLLVPCAVPPHKERAAPSAARHRLAMLRLAVEDRPGLEISTIEIDRGGLSYTIDTMRSLRDGTPRRRPVFILGTDSLAEIGSWREHRALLREFDLVAVGRPGADRRTLLEQVGPDVASRIRELSDGAPPDPPPGTGGRTFLLDVPPRDVSSSRIRGLAARKAALEGLVPPGVARYIRAHRLYQGEDPR